MIESTVSFNVKHIKCGQSSFHESQFSEIISSIVTAFVGDEQGTLTTGLVSLHDAREPSIIFRANERIYTCRSWVSLSPLNAIAVHDKMLPLGDR